MSEHSWFASWKNRSQTGLFVLNVVYCDEKAKEFSDGPNIAR